MRLRKGAYIVKIIPTYIITMNLETLTQKKPVLLGLLQSICGLAYITIIVTFLQNTEHWNIDVPEFVIAIVMLTLVVVSATIMGLFFLGMPIYLILKGGWPKALKIIGFTLLFSVMIIGVVLAVTLAVRT